MTEEYVTGSALCLIDDQLRILLWNEGAEGLTGIAAEDAVGRQCWEVVAGIDETGRQVCTPTCEEASSALGGRRVCSRELLIRSRSGRARVTMTTVAVTSTVPPRCLHLFHSGPDMTVPEQEVVRRLEDLTPRQRDVLGLVAEGVPAKVIARQLGLAQSTVRNYIREILIALGCHSQLEAMAKLRRVVRFPEEPAAPARDASAS